MLSQAVRNTLLRDLDGLSRQVEAYPDDALLWKVVPGIQNPAGTLALHLAGNLQHYVGAVLGGTGYVREREAELSHRDLPRTALLEEIAAARESTGHTLDQVGADRCGEEFPELVGGQKLRVGDFLVHLTAHFAYHLGQIDYHRRMLVPGAESLRMLQVGG